MINLRFSVMLVVVGIGMATWSALTLAAMHGGLLLSEMTR